MQIKPVIMAGGSGSRLWPVSRQLFPKQFLPLAGNKTMLQETINRIDEFSCAKNIVICNEEHRFLAAEQLSQINALDSLILEPFGRNTAPAIALAANVALNEVDESTNDDPLLLVLAADHVIENKEEFNNTIKRAIPLACEGKLVTFGIVPSSAHTGYGYIKAGSELNNVGFEVNEFVEKPNLETAQKYLETGKYYWNSGMFLFKASTYLEELKRFKPEIASACVKSLEKTTQDLDFIRIDADAFAKCPDDSIDYAVMERTDKAVVVPLDAGWNDIGSWSSLWDLGEKDDNGNVLNGDTLVTETNNTYVHADERLVATIGVDDLVIVDTKDALMVAHRDKVQGVKQIVNELKTMGRSEFNLHREVYRPWGKYDSIDNGERYQVKRITVKPGAKLSVQMHHHRAEHWIVVSGTAKVTNGDQTILLTENESTYIPVGVIHALENPGKVPLELIEVQSGSYLGEDDIVRFEDMYGRVEK